MAGIDLTGDRRSQLLEMLLAKQNQAPPQILSGVELAARLGEQLIRQRNIKKLQKQEAISQEDLVDALQGKLPKTRTQLEGFDDVPSEALTIPGKKTSVDSAVNQLPVGQQLAAQQVLTGRRELSDPTRFQQSKILQQNEQTFAREAREDTQAFQKMMQDDQQLSAADMQGIREAAASTRQARQIEAQMSEGDKDRLAEETNTIRQIQARFDLERLKGEIDKSASSGSIDLTEQQSKATSWYTSARAGNEVIKQELDKQYVPGINAVSLYAKSIDPDTGAATRVQMRRLISQRDLNFLDAANMVVDPVVRMRTGAAVRTDEFITTFNSMMPIGKNPQEIANKDFFRSSMIDAMGKMAAQGKALGDEIIEGKVPEQKGEVSKEVADIDRQIAEVDALIKSQTK